nr:trypsin-like serine protease [Deltaproteobacteria bacterium]
MLAWMAVIALGAAPDPVVRVVVGSAACAGAIISPGRVLTAYHCVAAGGRARITT